MKILKKIPWIILLMSYQVLAFELKPLGFNNLNYSKLTFENTKKNCNSIIYKGRLAKPVHEYITYKATDRLCSFYNEGINECYLKNRSDVLFFKCNDLSSKLITSGDALFAGVQFNDDPTRVSSRESTYKVSILDLSEVWYFEDIMNIPGTLINRSHYGDLQYLHAMKSEGGDFNNALNKSIEYISENFNLAKKIDILLLKHKQKELEKLLFEKVSNENYYYQFIGHQGQCEYKYFSKTNPNKLEIRKNEEFLVRTIFNQCHAFDYGENPKKYSAYDSDDKIRYQARAIGLLAIGSALHVIQDSYSSSHTERDSKTKAIKDFYSYPNDNDPKLKERKLHCQHDQYSKDNRELIHIAIIKSYEFLRNFAFINCNSFDNNGIECKTKIKDWLRSSVFNTN